MDWAKGKPDEYDMLQMVADAQASAGKLRQARETYSQAIEVARRGKVSMKSSPGPRFCTRGPKR